ncbi:MAG: zinc ABC transporter substrate-binding protein [Bauldia litoralis]
MAIPGRSIAGALVAAALVAAIGVPPRAVAAEAPAVVVTLKPLHSLIAGVMKGVGKPVLIEGARNPATPLDADQTTAIGRARLLFWLDARQAPRVAAQVAKRIDDLTVIDLMKAPGVRLMDARRGHRRVAAATARRPAAAAPKPAAPAVKDGNIVFRKRGDPAPKAAQPQRRAPARNWTSKAVPPANIATPDPHIWLDPRNAIAIVRAAAEALAKADPGNAARYRRNAAVLAVRIEALNDGLTATTRALRKARYAVTNIAFQYFEDHYLMTPALEFGLVAPIPAKAAIAAAHRQIAAAGLTCVFAPTALDQASGAALVAGTKARLVRLDVNGRGQQPGPEAYFTLVKGIGGKIAACLR